MAELEAENAALRRQLGRQPGTAQAPVAAAAPALPALDVSASAAPPAPGLASLAAAAPWRRPGWAVAWLACCPLQHRLRQPPLQGLLPRCGERAGHHATGWHACLDHIRQQLWLHNLQPRLPLCALPTCFQAPLPASLGQSAALVALTRHSSLPSGLAAPAAAPGAATLMQPQPFTAAVAAAPCPAVQWPQQGAGQQGASVGSAYPAGAAQQGQGPLSRGRQDEAARREAAAATIRAMHPAVKAHFVAHLLRLHPDLAAGMAAARERRGAAAARRVAPAGAQAPVQQAGLRMPGEAPKVEAPASRLQAGAGGATAAPPAVQRFPAANSPAVAPAVAAALAVTPLPATRLGACAVKEEAADLPPTSAPEWEHQLMGLPLFSFTTPDGAAAAPSPAGGSGVLLRPLSAQAAAALLASPPAQHLSSFATA